MSRRHVSTCIILRLFTFSNAVSRLLRYFIAVYRSYIIAVFAKFDI